MLPLSRRDRWALSGLLMALALLEFGPCRARAQVVIQRRTFPSPGLAGTAHRAGWTDAASLQMYATMTAALAANAEPSRAACLFGAVREVDSFGTTQAVVDSLGPLTGDYDCAGAIGVAFFVSRVDLGPAGMPWVDFLNGVLVRDTAFAVAVIAFDTLSVAGPGHARDPMPTVELLFVVRWTTRP
jgi:hypothetical protein